MSETSENPVMKAYATAKMMGVYDIMMNHLAEVYKDAYNGNGKLEPYSMAFNEGVRSVLGLMYHLGGEAPDMLELTRKVENHDS